MGGQPQVSKIEGCSRRLKADHRSVPRRKRASRTLIQQHFIGPDAENAANPDQCCQIRFPLAGDIMAVPTLT
jgi:hypothetical protein